MTTKPQPDAWGVSFSGKPVDLRTIYTHPRGAMVNAICILSGMTVRTEVTEEQIRDAFKILARSEDLRLVPLIVSEWPSYGPVDLDTIQMAPKGE